jgi:hypothetical protein
MVATKRRTMMDAAAFRSIYRAVSLLTMVGFVCALNPAAAQELPESASWTKNAWDAFNKAKRTDDQADWENSLEWCDKVIAKYKDLAMRDHRRIADDVRMGKRPPLEGAAPTEADRQRVFADGIMNDVATGYFIKGKVHAALGEKRRARTAFTAAKSYPLARCWDAQGWFWSLSRGAEEELTKL